MLIGGHDGNVGLASVELHNWKTGQQCFSTQLPLFVSYHSGVVMEKTAAFCGGVTQNYISTCFKLDIAKKQWKQV